MELVIRTAGSGQQLPAYVLGVNDDGTLRVRVFSDSDEDVWTEHDEAKEMISPVTDEHRAGRLGELVTRASAAE